MAICKRRRSSYTIKGTDEVIVRDGDCVLMRASDPGNPQFIGKIELIEENELHQMKVKVQRYYRPEESVGGRREHHGRKELFLSDQYDTQNGLTIQAKYNVHTVDNYVKLNTVAPEDFFCRFEYKVSTGTFDPDTVDHCFKCKKPYNPDTLMLQCVTCKDRFDPGCVNISDEAAKILKPLKCSKCSPPLDSYTIEGTDLVVKVNDCVLIRPSSSNKRSYVGIIRGIWSGHKNSKVEVELQWYYRPEDTKAGRQTFHGDREVFLSGHSDTQSALTIENKCNVHSIEDYEKLDQIGPTDFFSRSKYNPLTGGFDPDALYCNCQMPNNPDKLMVECERCFDWFHSACQGKTDHEVQMLEKFTCNNCLKDDTDNSKVAAKRKRRGKQ